MTAQEWLGVAGLIVGALAIREFVAGVYKTRADRAERLRALLVELNGRLQGFDANYFLLLGANAMKSLATSDLQREQNQKTWDTLGPKQTETIEWLARHELEFPRDIRHRIRALRTAMEFKDLDRLHDLHTILEQSQRVTDEVEAIRAELDRIVK